MTDNDKQLIKRAESLHATQWHEIEELSKKADTKEAIFKLHCIQTRLYHLEEYYSGLL